MKTFAYAVTSSLVTLIVVGIFLLLRTTPQRMAGTGSIPSTPVPHPTWTSTPSTPSPTSTPVPTATLPPQEQDWDQLVESAHRIPRDDLMRYHDDHVDKIVYFEGHAFDVDGEGPFLFILVSVVEKEGGVFVRAGNIHLGYRDAPVRVLEGDWVKIVGQFVGLYTYESVGSGMVTVPAVRVIQLKINDN